MKIWMTLCKKVIKRALNEATNGDNTHSMFRSAYMYSAKLQEMIKNVNIANRDNSKYSIDGREEYFSFRIELNSNYLDWINIQGSVVEYVDDCSLFPNIELTIFKDGKEIILLDCEITFEDVCELFGWINPLPETRESDAIELKFYIDTLIREGYTLRNGNTKFEHTLTKDDIYSIQYNSDDGKTIIKYNTGEEENGSIFLFVSEKDYLSIFAKIFESLEDSED